MTQGTTENVESIAMVRFKEVLARLAREFPLLTIEPQFEHPQVDAIADFPQQDGLDFKVSINLQYDEFQLNVGRFCLEWFPCTNQEVADDFADVVSGVLSGESRIIEHLSSGRPVKGKLQRLYNGAWETIGTWSEPVGLIPWPRPKRLVQNRCQGA